MPDITFKDIVEQCCRVEQWNSDTDCFIKCPGEHKHTHRTKTGDTRVWLEGNDLRLKCFHSSCSTFVYPLYGRLKTVWDAFGNTEPEEVRKAREEYEAARAELRHKFETLGSNLANTHPWPLNEIRENSPRTPGDGFAAFLDLFNEQDVIWVGQPSQSGMLHHTRFFQEARRWRVTGGYGGQFTCPSVFHAGARSRAARNVHHTPYLVVECDKLVPDTHSLAGKRANKDACGSVFRFLKERFSLKIRMIVDSGNKSLHCWYGMPDEQTMDLLNTVIPAVGGDKTLLSGVQPVRVPGIMREANGNMQEIVYYDN